MKKIVGLGVVVGTVFLLAAGISWGIEKKPLSLGKIGGAEGRGFDQPLRITAQELEADNKNRVITFRGKVEAKQGGLTINADMAQVFYEKKEEGNDIREVVATGNVKVKWDGFTLLSDSVLVRQEEDEAVAEGKVILRKEGVRRRLLSPGFLAVHIRR